MDKENENVIMKNVISDTMILTASCVIMYFWGIIYYWVLSDHLGFGINLFSIPIYNVIVMPWDNAVLSMTIGLGIMFFWKSRAMFLLLLYVVLSVLIYFGKKLFSLVKKNQWICRVLEGTNRKMLEYCQSFFDSIPKSISDDINEANAKSMVNIFFYLIFIVAIVINAQQMGKKALIDLTRFEKEKKTVEIKCRDDALLSGYYICAIGDSIIVDKREGKMQRRILIRSVDAKEITLINEISDTKLKAQEEGK